MFIEKFNHVKTGEVIYAVVGAKKRMDALKFVSQYKKMGYAKMLLTHQTAKGKINDDELYVENLKYVDGIDCWVVARDNINLKLDKVKE